MTEIVRSPTHSAVKPPWYEILIVFLRLGLTSFGGPIAHIGFFRAEFVSRRRWLNEGQFASLVALCQFMPGPASSQVGIAIGLSRGGLAGAIMAWIGFTLPSAFVLFLFAQGLTYFDSNLLPGVLYGLKIVAFAVVIQALIGMARQLCCDWPSRALALISAALLISLASVTAQLGLILLAAIIGGIFFRGSTKAPAAHLPLQIKQSYSLFALSLFALLLFGLPILLIFWSSHLLELINHFYQSGALVFGGGHVVLPLLESSTVGNGWISKDNFIAGYGLAQAVPGPLFTFAAFLGTLLEPAPNGLTGALICLLAIFLPSFLLVIGLVPFWNQLQGNRAVQGAVKAINATVVGLLLAACYDPIWTSTIGAAIDIVWVVIAFIALTRFNIAPWILVITAMLSGVLPTLF